MIDPDLPAYSPKRLRHILHLSLPIIAGLGSQNIMTLADTIMIGHVDTASLAALGITLMAIWVISSPFQGVSHAVQAITARRLGEERETELHRPLVNAGWLIILLGSPFAVVLIMLAPYLVQFLGDPEVRQISLEYLTIRLYTVPIIGLNFCYRGYFNGLHKSRVFMQTLLMAHPINVFLNWVLIFGNLGFPEMGAKGAAIGTAIASTLGCGIYVLQMIRHRNPGFSLSFNMLTRKDLKGLFELALPSCFQYTAMALGFLAFFAIAETISKETLAATNVLITTARVCFILSLGLGIATISLVGKSLGRGNPDEARIWVRSILIFGSFGIGAIGLAVAVFPKVWLSWFGLESSVLDLALPSLILLGFIQSYDAAGIILSHAHLGGGDTKRVMLISVINQWLFFLPVCFLWVNFFDGQLIHLWICMAFYRFFLFISFLVSIRGKSWLNVAI